MTPLCLAANRARPTQPLATLGTVPLPGRPGEGDGGAAEAKSGNRPAGGDLALDS